MNGWQGPSKALAAASDEDLVTSHLRLEANRRNAQLSTGPRTEAGRRKSSMNALRHGLTAEQVVLFDERLEDFEAFHRGLMAALKVEGGLEGALAERIIVCAWRLRRVYRIETGLFRKAQRAWTEATPTETGEIELVFSRITSHDNALAKLTRYETSIERSLLRALKVLEKRQAQRAVGPASVLIRIAQET